MVRQIGREEIQPPRHKGREVCGLRFGVCGSSNLERRNSTTKAQRKRGLWFEVWGLWFIKSGEKKFNHQGAKGTKGRRIIFLCFVLFVSLWFNSF